MTFLYRWLPIVMGCHCRPDRSFFWRGRQFPICARCTGLLAGAMVCLATLWLEHPPVPVLFGLLLPLILDGTVQKAANAYESTNLRRFWTGLFFGYALLGLFLLSAGWVFQKGYETGLTLFA